MDTPSPIPSSQITPEPAYLNRRSFLRGTVLAATSVATYGTYRAFNRRPSSSAPSLEELTLTPTTVPADMSAAFTTTEPKTSLDDITHYNNFYEFSSSSKTAVADLAENFITTPWTVTVTGRCQYPQTFDLDALNKKFGAEERVYRMRCVEAWSMVIPWAGFQLSRLLDAVQPLSTAKYVAFQTLLDPTRMPGQQDGVLDWPYVEGLRMDEAMHPLTLLATGLYGRKLPNQDGAPIRLVVPWKYGFKGIKSIVKIDLRETQPPTTWAAYASNEYGFYANVNPDVPHPRWSQATEQRIGESGRRDTLLFNGYAEQVAHLYAGMDLKANY